MFIETRTEIEKKLTFVASGNIKAYPCGRRRSTQIDRDNNDTTTTDRYYIPFDPEARLNTEANALKHSGINGYTQTYIKQFNDNDSNLFELALGGYLFSIDLSGKDADGNPVSYSSVDSFVQKLLETLEADSTVDSIFANILIEDVHLYSGFQEYYTGILREQYNIVDAKPEASLDLCKTSGDTANPDHYYFSGLSFSVAPLAADIDDDAAYRVKPVFVERSSSTVQQTYITLRLFKKYDAVWQLYQQALLPKISHGEDENSVNIDILYTNYIDTDNIAAADVQATDASITNISATNISASNIGTSEVKISNIYAESLFADGLEIGNDIDVTGNVTATKFTQSDNAVPHIKLVDKQLQIWTDGSNATIT